MRIISICIFTFALLAGIALQAGAQARRAPLVSPEFNADKSITFRFQAPNAKQVELTAQFLAKNLPMVKGERGVWSVTVQAPEPDLYPYCFIVDSIAVQDPCNVQTFPNERFKNSLIDVRGAGTPLYEMKGVPHGDVAYRFYYSEGLKDTRPLVIYTPPGYNPQDGKKYPVLYLIHGATDTHETWFKVGRMNFILDNLLAQGKAEPMIVAMPYANPGMTYEGRPNTHITGTDMTSELLKEIIPFMEKNYPVIPSADKRAIAGFSRGGGQTLTAGLGNPDVFGYVCGFAPAVNKQRVEESFSNKTYASPEELRKLKLLWLSCGTEDFLYQGALELQAKLEELNIPFEKMYTPGGHTWMNCRIYLNEIGKRIFK